MWLVLYGSVSGQAEDCADVIFNKLRKRNVEVERKPFGESSIQELQTADGVFVICSTTGDGALPPNTKPFWTKLLNKNISAQLNTDVFLFGIGSTAYPKFNWAIKKISTRLTQLGMIQPVLRSEANVIGPVSCEEVFDSWVEEVFKYVDLKHTLVETDGLLPPYSKIEFAPIAEEPNPEISVGQITDIELLTAPQYAPEVRRFQFNFDQFDKSDSDSTISHQCGDIINIYPCNDDIVVDAFIKSQGYEQYTNQKVKFNTFIPNLTFRDLVKWHLDLNCVPKRSFFELAQYFCKDPRHAERMTEFSKDLEDYFDYATRPVRSVIEIILEIDSLKIPIEYLLDILTPIRFRQFTISSAESIEITATNVKYRTGMHRLRKGLCSHMLHKMLQLGSPVYASFDPNPTPISTDSKLILVATGTGIALIKTILESFEYKTKPVFIYGCRFAGKDHLYPELAQKCTLHLATSRESKQYVQHVIKQHYQELDIPNSTIVVCGSSGNMPKSVKEAFIDNLQKSGYTPKDATDLINYKIKRNEYIQETW